PVVLVGVGIPFFNVFSVFPVLAVLEGFGVFVVCLVFVVLGRVDVADILDIVFVLDVAFVFDVVNRLDLGVVDRVRVPFILVIAVEESRLGGLWRRRRDRRSSGGPGARRRRIDGTAFRRRAQRVDERCRRRMPTGRILCKRAGEHIAEPRAVLRRDVGREGTVLVAGAGRPAGGQQAGRHGSQ